MTMMMTMTKTVPAEAEAETVPAMARADRMARMGHQIRMGRTTLTSMKTACQLQ